MSQENVNQGRDQFILNGNVDALNIDNSDRAQQQVKYDWPNCLPPKVEGFVERLPQQTVLRQWLTERRHLSGIVGFGGFGKSSLASWAFRLFEAQFEKALWLSFSRDDARTFSQFARYILQELGFLVSEALDDAALSVQLVLRLRKRNCLLVLDQVELLESLSEEGQAYFQFLRDWQERGEKSSVLLTTRRRLFAEEIPWLELAGLTLVESAVLLPKGYQFERGSSLAELVKVTSGHPMLLKLATAWLVQVKIRQQERLKIDAADVAFFGQLAQQQNLEPEALVEEIVQLLVERGSETIRAFLPRVSVYRGAFALGAAQAMAAVTETELEELTNQSLLIAEGERWRLHPLVLGAVRDIAQQSGFSLDAHEQAIGYFASKLHPDEGSVDAGIAIEIFHHHCELEQYALAKEVMDSCVGWMQRRGYYRILAEQVYGRLVDSWTVQEEPEQRSYGQVLLQLGQLWYFLDQRDLALALYRKRLLPLTQKIRDCAGEANTRKAIADVLQFKKRSDEALDNYRAALDIYKDIEDRLGEANTLNGFGKFYLEQREVNVSIEYHQEALAIVQAIGDLYTEAATWFYLGNALEGGSNTLDAKQAYQQAYQLFSEIGVTHYAEICEKKIQTVGQSIPKRPIQAPSLREPEPELPDWYIKSLPSESERTHPSAGAAPREKTSQSSQPWGVYVVIAVVTAILIIALQ